jgi:phytoene synthase
VTAHDDIVRNAVREADPDRYLSTLYAPAEKRTALFSLYAFNAEIASVRDRIREALPGEVRLQWWREVIDGERAADGHPLAEALLATIAAHNLPRAAFANYLEARMFDLFDDPMPTRGDLEGYCGETASALIQLALLILDADAAPPQSDLAGHAGCAQAITGLLRLVPLHRARGQCYVPRDILTAAGTTPEEFLVSGGDAASARAVEAMIALAADHLAAFRKGAAALPETLRPAFLPMALVPDYLKRLSIKGPRALAEMTDMPAWRRHWVLLRAALRGW